jgi:hypothetical protein
LNKVSWLDKLRTLVEPTGHDAVMFLTMRRFFPLRASEWILAFMMISWGIVLAEPTSTFELTPIYVGLQRIGSEETWSWICLSIGSIRLFALMMNDTWPRITLPLRTLMSFASCFFWFQVTLGIIAAGIAGIANTAIAVYPWLAVLDVVCMYRTGVDHARYRKTSGPDLVIQPGQQDRE